MTIKVIILEDNEIFEFNEQEIGITEIFRRLKLSPSEYIVIKNGSVTVESDVAKDGDEIVLFTVKSGG